MSHQILNTGQLAEDLKAAADFLEDNGPRQARANERVVETLRRLARSAELHEPVYAHPARDTADGIAYTLDAEPKPQSDYQVLYRSLLSQLAADTLVAWTSGEISEGQASHLLGIDRLTLRQLRIDALNRVTGEMNTEQVAARRITALAELDTAVEGVLDGIQPPLDDEEAFAARTLWAAATRDGDVVQAFEEWRALSLPHELRPLGDDD